MIQHLDTLKQRRNWLTERIKAKQTVGWDVQWDIAERDALSWAVELLELYTTYWRENVRKEESKTEIEV